MRTALLHRDDPYLLEFDAVVVPWREHGARAFVTAASAATVSFHLGERVSTIDLDHRLTEAQLAAAATLANRVVQEARPVRTWVETRAEEAVLAGLASELRSHSAPRP